MLFLFKLLPLLTLARKTSLSLDAGGVEHDTDGRTERLRGKGSLELGTNFTGGTVRTSNLSPDGASLGTVDGLLGAVNESDTLTQVSTSFSLRRDVLEFEDGSLGGLGVLGTLVSHVTSLSEESKKKGVEGVNIMNNNSNSNNIK